MAKREKKTVVAGVTQEQYQEAMSVYAQYDAMHDKLLAKMNGEVTKVREKYDSDLEACVDVKEKNMTIIETYCTENKAVLFVQKRHIENAHGKVGFRLGTPKLKTLPKWTWDKVLQQLKTVLPDYVRKVEEVDKERLILDRADDKVSPMLNEVGVYVTQEESFYIELKKEEAAAV